jgi:hypothetical protein
MNTPPLFYAIEENLSAAELLVRKKTIAVLPHYPMPVQTHYPILGLTVVL